jgi:uncharacterized protein YlxW (UPF0749 family)
MSNTSSGTARDDKLAESIKQIRSQIAQLQTHVAKTDKTINAALADIDTKDYEVIRR